MRHPRTVALIQARLGSSRLPGKTLADVAGKPMVVRVIERALRIEGLDGLLAVIPDLAQDDPLNETIRGAGVDVFRGNSDDVLDRFARAARGSNAEVIVRITADCPLLSPAVSSRVLEAFWKGGADYASNTLERTWPRGLDTEVVSRSALEVADREATSSPDREHVTRYVWRQPERFRLNSVRRDGEGLSALRWTVDEPVDLELVRAIYREAGNGEFDLEQVLDILSRRPELRDLNASVRQADG